MAFATQPAFNILFWIIFGKELNVASVAVFLELIFFRWNLFLFEVIFVKKRY